MRKQYALKMLLIVLSMTLHYIHANDFIPWPLDTAIDLTHFSTELANITLLKSKKELPIKSASALNGIKNLITSALQINDPFTLLYFTQNQINSKRTILWNIIDFTQIFHAINNLVFALNDKKIFTNSKNIAELNNDSKTKITYNKKQQILWLTANMLLPYFLLIIKRLVSDKSGIKNLFFYEDRKDFTRNNNNNTALLFYARLLCNFSEEWRRDLFYKQINSKLDSIKIS